MLVMAELSVAVSFCLESADHKECKPIAQAYAASLVRSIFRQSPFGKGHGPYGCRPPKILSLR